LKLDSYTFGQGITDIMEFEVSLYCAKVKQWIIS